MTKTQVRRSAVLVAWRKADTESAEQSSEVESEHDASAEEGREERSASSVPPLRAVATKRAPVARHLDYGAGAAQHQQQQHDFDDDGAVGADEVDPDATDASDDFDAFAPEDTAVTRKRVFHVVDSSTDEEQAVADKRARTESSTAAGRRR